ncbi:MAG: EAL domain-containing protein [Rhodocyclaceae bacterium]|nr:MAG: EAL domain-containing protein [Rhodocyclaceae bacterium]
MTHHSNSGSDPEKVLDALKKLPVGAALLRLADGGLQWASPRFHALLAREAASFEGMDLLAWIFSGQYPHLPLEQVALRIRSGLASNQEFKVPAMLLPEGSNRLVAATVALTGAEDQVLLTLTELQHHSAFNLLERVFLQSGEAILITNAQNRIVTVNPAFTALTGYTLEEVLGQDPKILSSGRSSAEDVEAMWRTLADDQFWQGEIWDRHKSGEIYPKWMSISTVRNAAGEVENYIARFTNIAERKATEERLVYMSQHDPLTQLFNRTMLQSQLQTILARARRDQQQAAVLLIDLDRFKSVNDTLGHHVGDQLLIAIANRLRETVRASDIVARLGGDEFVVLLPDIQDAMSVTGIVSKIRLALEDSYRIDRHVLYATPSIGVSLYPLDGEDEETLLKNADTAMYHAKAEGRNNFQFFAKAMNHAAVERMKLETALRQAVTATQLGQSRFKLHYQPQVHLDGNAIDGLEALLRWTDPELGSVPPAKFIPIAEETGLIQPLGDWVFWESCRQLREFKDQGFADLHIAVNLSAQQLRHENLPSVVRGALACYNLSPSDIEFEITESVAMQNPVATIAVLDQLSDIGIVLAIDDFGTGYSSLAYLKHLPIQRLKLDRTFVKDIESDRDDEAICSATIVLAHNLGLELVAEGVETAGQEQRLKQLGCDVIQGFLHSKPLPAAEVADFLGQWKTSHQTIAPDPCI